MESLQLNLGSYQLAVAVSKNDNEYLVALRPLCETLGLDWKSQHRRTASNPQFRCGHMTTVDAQGRNYPMVCIPVRQVGMWLCTINANRVSENVRPKLLAFQEQLQIVIHDHLTGRLTLEKLQQMEQVMRGMEQTIAHMYGIIESQAVEIQKLKQSSDYHMTLEASCAGRQLAAAKKIKSIVN